MKTKHINYFLQIIFGLTFIFSAFSKLFPIDQFEILLVEDGISNWFLTSFIARIIIASELFLGFLLIINIKPKIVLSLSLFILLIFTIYLSYKLMISGNLDNCLCFGERIKMNTKDSILKNTILIILNLFLIKNFSEFIYKYKKIIIISFCIIALILPFALNPVYYDENRNAAIKIEKYNLHIDSLGIYDFQGKEYNLNEGKKIVCFFAIGCNFCKMADSKLAVIQKKSKFNLPIYIVIAGKKDKLTNYVSKLKTKAPYKYFKAEKVVPINGDEFPTVYLLENGYVIDKMSFNNLYQDRIEKFINEK